MKNVKRIASLIVAIAMILATFVPVYAASISAEEMQKSIVYIEQRVEYTPKNVRGLTSFKTTYAGTGFAVGLPGKPVQYIATADHVISEDGGVFKVTVINNSIVHVESYSGKYPSVKEYKDGTVVVTDYFNAKVTSLTAYYSLSTDDKVTLSVVQRNHNHDVALCKIASEPTTKIAARPLRKYAHVKVGEDVIAIGYPGTSDVANDEGRFDSADSTVTKGIISKLQLTTGMYDSSTQYYTYLVDAQTATGNSGGPLLDTKGNILGVCSFHVADSEQAVKANYFIVVDEIIALLNAADVPYKLIEPVNTTLIIILAAAAALLLIVLLIVVLAVRSKKKQAAPVAAVSGNSETEMINQSFAPAASNIGATMPEKGVGKVYLLGVKGHFDGKKYSIEDRVVIGRDNSRCNVIYPSDQPGVSAVHCEILLNNGTLYIKDCNSTYGTYLADGKRITPNVPVMLPSGAQFWVGGQDNIFEVKY